MTYLIVLNQIRLVYKKKLPVKVEVVYHLEAYSNLDPYIDLEAHWVKGLNIKSLIIYTKWY